MAGVIDPLGDLEEESQRSSDPRTMCHFDFPRDFVPQLTTSVTTALQLATPLLKIINICIVYYGWHN